MITPAELANEINADSDYDGDALQRAIDVAEALVERAVAGAWREVPDVIRDECVRRTATNIFKQAGTGDGVPYADGTGGQIVANNPLQKSWDLIKPYINRV